MLSARGGASERERLQSARMTQREFLRDHPAHRDTEKMRALEFELVEQPERVIREHLD